MGPQVSRLVAWALILCVNGIVTVFLRGDPVIALAAILAGVHSVAIPIGMPRVRPRTMGTALPPPAWRLADPAVGVRAVLTDVSVSVGMNVGLQLLVVQLHHATPRYGLVAAGLIYGLAVVLAGLTAVGEVRAWRYRRAHGAGGRIADDQ